MTGLFGIDGIRGVVNKSLTPELAFRLGQAGAVAFASGKEKLPRVLIAKDTRASSDMIEAALSAGACSVGAQIMELGVVPVPALAYLVVKYKMDGGVMISASDEPMEYNGITFFDSKGLRIDENTEKIIEEYATGTKDISQFLKYGKDVGRITCSHTALRDYVDYVKKNAESDLCGMKIAIDCANGAAYQCAKLIFKELGADVEMINNVPDGININHNCGTKNPQKFMEYVVSHRCTFGLVIGGSADNVIAVDECGKTIEISKFASGGNSEISDGIIESVKLATAIRRRMGL